MQRQAEPCHPSVLEPGEGSQDSSPRPASWEVGQLMWPRGLGGEPLALSPHVQAQGLSRPPELCAGGVKGEAGRG